MITTGQDAPSSSDSFFTPARAAMRSPMPVEPVNDTFRTRGSATSSVAQRAARAGQHRQHTLGQPGVDEARRQRQRGERGGAGGLRARPRSPPPAPGAILCSTSSDGKLNGVIATTTPTGWRTVKPILSKPGALVRVQRQRVAVELGALERREPDQVARAACLGRRLGDRLAVLGAERRRDLRRALVGQLRRPQQDPHPLVSRRTPPDHRAALRGRQRELDIRRSADGDLAHNGPVERRTDLLGLAGPGGHPLAADQQLGVRQRSLLGGLIGLAGGFQLAQIRVVPHLA